MVGLALVKASLAISSIVLAAWVNTLRFNHIFVAHLSTYILDPSIYFYLSILSINGTYTHLQP